MIIVLDKILSQSSLGCQTFTQGLSPRNGQWENIDPLKFLKSTENRVYSVFTVLRSTLLYAIGYQSTAVLPLSEKSGCLFPGVTRSCDPSFCGHFS